jgi:galactose mutarotase-like enzyme
MTKTCEPIDERGAEDVKIVGKAVMTQIPNDLNASVVDLFTAHNAGIELSAMTYGATITSLRVPDGDGRLENIVARRRARQLAATHPHFSTAARGL